MIRPQVDFPFLEEYKKHFEITERTIFAFGADIYTNYRLTPDLLVHEMKHLEQQAKYAEDDKDPNAGYLAWVHDFLYDPAFRLSQEVEAYRSQLESIKDRNHRTRVHVESAKQLSSPMYGNICTYKEAYELIKVKR